MLAFVLFAAQAAAVSPLLGDPARWWWIGTTTEAAIYVDNATIRRDGAHRFVQVETMFFEQPNQVSLLETYEIDCTAKMSAVTARTTFHRAGAPEGITLAPGSYTLVPIADSSIEKLITDFSCPMAVQRKMITVPMHVSNERGTRAIGQLLSLGLGSVVAAAVGSLDPTLDGGDAIFQIANFVDDQSKRGAAATIIGVQQLAK